MVGKQAKNLIKSFKRITRSFHLPGKISGTYYRVKKKRAGYKAACLIRVYLHEIIKYIGVRVGMHSGITGRMRFLLQGIKSGVIFIIIFMILCTALMVYKVYIIFVIRKRITHLLSLKNKEQKKKKSSQ